MPPVSGLLQGFLLMWITIIKLSLGQIERDIILTPKLAYHIHGKTLYYEPGQNFIQQNESSHVPWEQTLKHVTYLTLNNEIDKTANISQYPDYKKFQQSSYIQSHEYIPKFGDIITLARGRLEKLNASNYRFVEGPCSKNCAEEPKLVAHWLVEKIRHRDADRNFRYEMKFSVNPILIDKSDSKRAIGKSNKVRAFILKDDDYPNNFVHLENHIAQRRYDENKDYVDKLHRFNEIFSKPKYYQGSESSTIQRYTNPKMPELNIGEYVRPIQTSMSRIGHAPNRVVYPTTYRPTYHLKFVKPMNLGEYNQKNPQYTSDSYTKNIAPPVASTHLHHHYYVSKSQLPVAEKYIVNPSYLKDHRGALDIIEQPTTTTISPITHHHAYHTPPPISNQIPMPPNMNTHIQINQSPYPMQVSSPIIQASPLIYMHPVPITQHVPVYIYPKHNEQTENPSNRPFIQSPKDEGVRYSEPDPLYDNKNNYNSENTLIPSNEDHSDVESTSPQYLENNYGSYVGGVQYADNQDESYESVTAQLPSPGEDQHHTIPVPETTTKEEEITPSHFEKDTTYGYPHSTSTDSILKHSIIKELDNEASYSHSTSKEHDQGHTEPLMQTSVITQTSATSSLLATPEALTSPEAPTEATKATATTTVTEQIIENQITDEKPKAEKLTTKPSFSEKKVTQKSRYYFYRSTTERPVLKWKPKKTKLTKLNTTPMTTSSTLESQSTNTPKDQKYEFERVPVNFTEKIIAVTPTKSDSVPTKKSVSTSISIKVGTEEEERPFVTPTISIPNVELVQAQLKNVKTSLEDIKLYKASDQRRKISDVDDSDEEELTKSIVEHVKSLQ